jgi:hypothetical protein
LNDVLLHPGPKPGFVLGDLDLAGGQAGIADGTIGTLA